MMINPKSTYPDIVDPMTFFHDISLNNIAIMKEYEKLITENNYDDANALIESKKGMIFGYFADYCNLIENRIYNLQNYLLQIDKKSIQLFTYGDIQPSSITMNTIWI